MKILKIALGVWLSLAMAAMGFAAIPGTLQVTAPIAPPSTSSTFGAVDARYVQGGYNTSFDNIGDWNNTAILPDGRCHLNMRVSAKSDTNHQVFRLISLSPRTWELDVDATRAAATNGILVNPTASGLILSDGTANKLMVFDGTKHPIAFTGTANRVMALDGSGNPTTTSVTPTEINYASGLAQNIQSALTALQGSRVNIGWVGGDSGDILLASGAGTAVSSGMNMSELTNFVSQLISDLTGVGATTNSIYLPTTYYDNPDGSTNALTNATARTAFFQSYIDLTASKYTNGIRAALMVPAGKMTMNQIYLRGNTIMRAIGEFVHDRADDSLPDNRGLWSTVRANGIVIAQTNGVINAFSSWVSGYDNPDAWYGTNDNILIDGPGRFILNPNGKAIGDPIMLLNEVSNFVVNGAIEIRHTTGYAQWGIRMTGRNVLWYNPIIKNGTLTGQDGLHICSGRNILVLGGDLNSGDDSVAIGTENAGGSNVGPDEDASDMAFVGLRCDSKRARACMFYSGVNRLSVPYTKGHQVRRITWIGSSGWVAKDRQAAVQFEDYREKDKIYSYTWTAGSGYTDGVYTAAVTGGGGSGAQCVFKCQGGVIVGAWPRYDTGTTWYHGSGYTSNGTVDTSGHGGTGGTITAIHTVTRNDMVEDIYFQGSHKVGSLTHENADSINVGFAMAGCRRVKLDLTVEFVQNPSYPQHRPFVISSADDVDITLKMINACQKAGTLNSASFANQPAIGRVNFLDCKFIGTLESGSAPIKLLGTNGIVCVRNCTTRDLPNNVYMIRCPDYETSKYNTTGTLIVTGCSVTHSSGSPSNSGIITIPDNDVAGVSIGRLIMRDNIGSASISGFWPTAANIQSEVSKWNISGNVGFVTVVNKTGTIAAGSTSLSVTCSTATGLTSTADDGLANIHITPVGNWGSATKFWLSAVDATHYAINVDAAPGGSGLKFAIHEDTSDKN